MRHLFTGFALAGAVLAPCAAIVTALGAVALAEAAQHEMAQDLLDGL